MIPFLVAIATPLLKTAASTALLALAGSAVAAAKGKLSEWQARADAQATMDEATLLNKLESVAAGVVNQVAIAVAQDSSVQGSAQALWDAAVARFSTGFSGDLAKLGSGAAGAERILARVASNALATGSVTEAAKNVAGEVVANEVSSKLGSIISAVTMSSTTQEK